MDNFIIKFIPYLISIGVGFALAFFFFKPEITESIVIKTETRTDTVYNSHVDTIWLAYETLIETIDTVYYSEPFKADVSVYSGSEVLEYGKVDWMAETTGKLVNFSMIPHLQLPTIIKEIETVKTVTQAKDLRGLYAGASASLDLDYKLGASYVDKSWMFNYDYQPKIKQHWIGVRKRIF